MFGALLDSRPLEFISNFDCIETFKTVQSTVCSPCVLMFIALSFFGGFFFAFLVKPIYSRKQAPETESVCIKHFEDSAVKFDDM